MAKNVRTTLRREAGEVKKYRMTKKIVASAIAAIFLFLILVYIISILYSNSGSFTVTVMDFDKVKHSLVLSEEPKFSDFSARLSCQASKEVTNISADSIPADVDTINGAHSGENYVAYTFYCKNNGKETLDYSYELYITNITKNLDKAVRVKLFVDGEGTTYARPASDGSGAEPNTVTFRSANTIAKDQISNFQPNSVTKYTVVIWLEGNDPDCVDDKLGGEFKIDMSIKVLGTEKG